LLAEPGSSAEGFTMDSKLRAEIIRQGNEAYNNKDYKKAKECFYKTDYKDGLIRLGDYYMYERRLPLLAYSYYKKAGAIDKIQDIHKRMIYALGEWIGRDKIKEETLPGGAARVAQSDSFQKDDDGMIPVQVSPALREAALKILQKR
jgi:hypothetical protein